MAAPPYDQPGANVVFWGLVALFALGEHVVRIRSRLSRRGTQSERWSLLVVIVAIVGGLVAALAFAQRQVATISTGRWPLFVLGIAAMVAGLVVRHWAIHTLGRFFTVDVRVQPGQTVVESGPYRWVRHPSYTGMILFFTGLGLALSDWASLATLVVVPAAGLVVRIRSEERALLDGLGEPYRRFAATRRRLIPGVW
ncbi:MAG TPA: isoprenylcysteine carboxylmethyltransferase family protein [Acidimicrobiales bacterium]